MERRYFSCLTRLHLFKNFYSNFQKRKSFTCPPFNGEEIDPDFGHLIQLYDLEAGKPLKIRGCICHTAYSASTPPGRVKTCARQLINYMRVDNQNKQSFPFDLLKGRDSFTDSDIELCQIHQDVWVFCTCTLFTCKSFPEEHFYVLACEQCGCSAHAN